MMQVTDQKLPNSFSDSNLPQFTIEYLNSFEKKVLDDDATLKDYNDFKTNIKPYGLSSLLENEMKKYGIYSFEQFMKERRKDKNDPTRIRYVDSGVIGIFRGMINALRILIK